MKISKSRIYCISGNEWSSYYSTYPDNNLFPITSWRTGVFRKFFRKYREYDFYEFVNCW